MEKIKILKSEEIETKNTIDEKVIKNLEQEVIDLEEKVKVLWENLENESNPKIQEQIKDQIFYLDEEIASKKNEQVKNVMESN